MWTAFLLAATWVAPLATQGGPPSDEQLPPGQQTWIVSQAGAGLGSGTAQDPFTNISYAVSRSFVQSGDEIVVFPGTYENEEIDFFGKDLTLRSTEGPALTTIVARPSFGPSDPHSALIVRSGESDVQIDGFRVTGGTGSPECTGFTGVVGGALAVCGGSAVTVRDCVFQGNTAELGGAIFAQASTLNLDDCAFLGPGTGTRGEAVWLEGSTGTFSGCRFEDFFQIAPTVPQGGGAVVAETSVLVLQRCSFEDNATRFFGAHLWSRTSDVVASGCVFGRSVGYAGASLSTNNGTLRLVGCTVRDAMAIQSPGGGLFTSGTIVEIQGCLFEDNVVTGPREGGAIGAQAGRLSIKDTEFIGNSAGQGGAISVVEGAGTSIDHCSFVRNSAPSGGGAISIVDAIPRIMRSTFILNTALPEGSGGAVRGRANLVNCSLTGNVAGESGGAVSNQTRLYQSIAWRNSPQDLDDDTSASYSLVGSPGNAPVTDRVIGDPLFWSSTDLHLLPGSVAIDAGAPGGPLDLDGSRVDLGAFTFDPFYCPPDCAETFATNECTSLENSTGQVAGLTAVGSPDSDLNRLILVATGLPPGAATLLLASQTTDLFNVPAILGPLCLGAPVLRIPARDLFAREDGSSPIWIRLGSAGGPLGPSGTRGETWNFQMWYRDAGPQMIAPSNTSNSISVILQ